MLIFIRDKLFESFGRDILEYDPFRDHLFNSLELT